MDLRELGCDPRDGIALAEDRDRWRAYVRAVMNLRVPWKPISYRDISIVTKLPTFTLRTKRGGSVVTHETLIREVPGSNPVAANLVEVYSDFLSLKISKEFTF